MQDRPRLPDIRPLLEDDRVDRPRVAMRLLGNVLILAAIALLTWAATIAWDVRHFSRYPDGAFAALAVGCLAVPVAVGVVSARRQGWSILVMQAVIAPVVVWITVVIVMILASRNVLP